MTENVQAAVQSRHPLWKRPVWWLLAVVLLIPAALLGAAVVNYTGYCIGEGRNFTGEELIRRTVQGLLTTYPRITYSYETLPKAGYEVVTDKARCCGEGDRSRFDGSKGGTPLTAEQLIPYRDIDEFFAINPGCCTYARDGLYGELATTSLWSKVTGYSSGFVSVKYKVRYRDAAGRMQERFSGWSTNYSNCGRPVNTVFD